jgi:hypothetical protein
VWATAGDSGRQVSRIQEESENREIDIPEAEGNRTLKVPKCRCNQGRPLKGHSWQSSSAIGESSTVGLHQEIGVLEVMRTGTLKVSKSRESIRAIRLRRGTCHVIIRIGDPRH